MLNFDELKLVAIGLGYVGLPLAIELDKQRSVLGFDINVNPSVRLKPGIALETYTSEFTLKRVRGLCATASHGVDLMSYRFVSFL
ncbi:hypothetical protein [Pseudomonas spirodelae]|uniref:UDP-N-acetyl-D-galactosamine dehydrogenase n=1 Tax=Pseudomonas spirodelae TaxID=3101751 RepID=A0ABU5P6X4_9PSED|nr:hypothetical protein [Pseudomonas sp. T5W1]MEA1605399.1 hypothetical protein [Pseudomonas sp. T5W1]